MKNLRYIIFTFAAVLSMTAAARADDFVFKYREGAVMPMSMDFEREHVAAEFYSSDDEAELQRLLEAGIIEYYEPNITFELMDVANDADYNSQRSYEFKLTNAVGAVNNPDYNGKGVKVGIIDSGLVEGHTDIDYSRVVAKKNIVSDGDNVNDTIGHGTAVAGVIAAKTNNELGTASLAPEADLVIIKAFPDGSKSTSLSYLIRSLNYAINQGCDVINMSIGSKYEKANETYYKSLQDMITRAEEKGIIVVAAAGNHDSDTPYTDYLDKDSPLMYPAALGNVVSVASINSLGDPSYFSYHNSAVNVAACGSGVRVLNYGDLAGTCAMSGTSFAAPFVTAVAAVVKQIKPEITTSEFIALLGETATDAGDEGWDPYYGSGIVNVGRLLDTLLGINIAVSDTELNDKWMSVSSIANYGFDSYDLMDLWYMESSYGVHYNNKIRNFTINPRTIVTFEYQGWYTVYHMVWLQEGLSPVCSPIVLDTGIGG